MPDKVTAQHSSASLAMPASPVAPASPVEPLTSADTDWLTPARKKPLLTKGLTGSFIHKHQHNDWFISLANALIGIGEVQQSRSLTKVYIFLRMFMPEGLTGRWAHLGGKSLMDHLLSHPEALCVSRHRVTRDADAALTELEKWMAQGSTWMEAWKHAKVSLASQKGVKRRDTSRAPILFSPEHIIMILILSYPNMKYHERIRRLQIGWMSEARETLNVREGYWKGITCENVGSIFVPEDAPRVAQVDLLLDYNRLFGKEFPRFRQDIRPCLPNTPWAQSIKLLREPSDDEDNDDGMAVEDQRPENPVLRETASSGSQQVSRVSIAGPTLSGPAADSPLSRDPTPTDPVASFPSQRTRRTPDLVAIASAAIQTDQDLQTPSPSSHSICSKRVASPDKRPAKRSRIVYESGAEPPVPVPSPKITTPFLNNGEPHSSSPNVSVRDELGGNLIALRDDITKTVFERMGSMQSAALTDTRVKELAQSALHDGLEKLDSLDKTFSTKMQELDLSFREHLGRSSVRTEIREGLAAFQDDIIEAVRKLGKVTPGNRPNESAIQPAESIEVRMEAMQSTLHAVLARLDILDNTLSSQIQEIDMSFQESLAEVQVFIKKKLYGMESILIDGRHRLSCDPQASSSGPQGVPEEHVSASVETLLENHTTSSTDRLHDRLLTRMQQLDGTVVENSNRLQGLMESRLGALEQKLRKIDERLDSIHRYDSHQHDTISTGGIQDLKSTFQTHLDGLKHFMEGAEARLPRSPLYSGVSGYLGEHYPAKQTTD